MKPLVLTLRRRPDQRLDLAPLVPDLLAGKSAAEIAAIAVQTTREPVSVGDVFGIRMGDAMRLRIEGGDDRLDNIGTDMGTGEITVEGDVGLRAGRRMRGGHLRVTGSAGPWAASGLRGGVIEIDGDAGERLGGPLPGEAAGMRGGIVVVRRDAGERAGDRLRRGTIVIEGSTGPYAGSRMIAGTLMVRGGTGALPGYLMRRGTIVLGRNTEFSPGFVDCGTHDLVAMRLMSSFVASHSLLLARLLRRPLRRLTGDTAVLGLGEIFTPL